MVPKIKVRKMITKMNIIMDSEKIKAPSSAAWISFWHSRGYYSIIIKK